MDGKEKLLPGFPISDIIYQNLSITRNDDKTISANPVINIVSSKSFREGCKTNKDCQGSYCMNYSPHIPPYVCHDKMPPHNCPSTFSAKSLFIPGWKDLGKTIEVTTEFKVENGVIGIPKINHDEVDYAGIV